MSCEIPLQPYKGSSVTVTIGDEEIAWGLQPYKGSSVTGRSAGRWR